MLSRAAFSAVLAVLALIPAAPRFADASCHAPLTGWGISGSGPGQFNYPIALALDTGNRWLVCDQHNNRIQMFDLHGTFLGTFGDGAGLFHPSGIAVGNNRVYVADHQNHRLVMFDETGMMLGAVSTPPHPVGVAVDGQGFVYVGVAARVRKLTVTGGFVADLGGGVVQRPYGVRIGPDGALWVSDYGNHRVHRLTTGGAHLSSLGSLGSAPGQFYSPENVAFAADGRFYVADTGNDRVQVFSPAMTWLCAFGTTGSGPHQLDVPSDVAIDPMGWIVVVDYGNNRIRVWGDPPVSAVPATWGEVKRIYR